jgi:hypothetical protein
MIKTWQEFFSEPRHRTHNGVMSDDQSRVLEDCTIAGKTAGMSLAVDRINIARSRL